MSLIERALERLKQEAAARKEQVPTAPATPVTAVHSAEPVRPVEAAGDSSNIVSLPHRQDRIVSVDLAALQAAGAIAPANEQRRLAEEYRIIKRPLLKAVTQGEPSQLRNVVAVTSALPGEGKTFTSVNLALSLALERNREVVLVDGDTAKRNVTHLFRLDGELGLLDSGGDAGATLESTLVKTDLPSLYLLPAGDPHSEATEILSSERTRALITELASDPRRIVLIDCPPLLVTSEAGVLAALAGQVVVVVKASDTPQEVVVRAIEAVTEDKPVSLLLNQVLSAPERHYGYYYGGYGYGYKYGEKDIGTPAQEDRG